MSQISVTPVQQEKANGFLPFPLPVASVGFQILLCLTNSNLNFQLVTPYPEEPPKLAIGHRR